MRILGGSVIGKTKAFQIESIRLDRKCLHMKRTCLISFLYLFLTVLFTFPLIKNLDDSFVELGDRVLNAYILSWDTHALLTDPLNLFGANTFYPAKLSLT